MKTILSTALLLLCLLSLAACNQEPTPPTEPELPDQSNVTPPVDPASQDEAPEAADYTVAIEVQDFGVITVALDGSAAPITVEHFIKLVNDGFYDGLTFHRILSGFMIQGGDPLGNGTGGSDESIKGEFSSNGVENPLSHTRGVISMARSFASNDSASSQFFLVHQDAPHLDGDYAAFGTVTDGMDVVDAICETITDVGSNGEVAAEDQPVITSIRVVEDA